MFEGAIDLLAQPAETLEFQLKEDRGVAAVTVIIDKTASNQLGTPATALVTQTPQRLDSFPVIE